MSSWSELLTEFVERKDGDPRWLDNKLKKQLTEVSKLRNDTAVIFYASSFLQKRLLESSITSEDINGFMDALHGADTKKGLTLILHTPGGDINAVESIVDYLHAKFKYIEVIVPYLAMSGGSMISLASNLLVLGNQSQLGPIDPQITIGNKTHSARAIQEAFDRAKEDIKSDVSLGHLWAPILQNMGPSLIEDAGKALSYSRELVVNWLNQRMFERKDKETPEEEEEKRRTVSEIAGYFNAEKTENHGNVHVHGQRIGIQKLIKLKINVESLEKDQKLQDTVLTAYHLMTLIFENTPSIKFIVSNKAKMWAKNSPIIPPPALAVPVPVPPPPN